MRRILSILFVALFIGAAGWLAHRAAQPEVLPTGSALPPLRYLGANGPATLRPHGGASTLVVWFHSECLY